MCIELHMYRTICKVLYVELVRFCVLSSYFSACHSKNQVLGLPTQFICVFFSCVSVSIFQIWYADVLTVLFMAFVLEDPWNVAVAEAVDMLPGLYGDCTRSPGCTTAGWLKQAFRAWINYRTWTQPERSWQQPSIDNNKSIYCKSIACVDFTSFNMFHLFAIPKNG